MAALAASCPQLSSLNLWGCDKITDAAVAALAASCPQLNLDHLRGKEGGTHGIGNAPGSSAVSYSYRIRSLENEAFALLPPSQRPLLTG
eukprot:2633852-Prymnesium_polylepis.2